MMAWMKHVMGIWAERSSMASSKIAFTSLRCLCYTKTLQIQTVTSVTKNVTQSRESILFIYLCTSLNKWFDNLSSNPDWKLSRRYRFEELRLSSLRFRPFILTFSKLSYVHSKMDTYSNYKDRMSQILIIFNLHIPLFDVFTDRFFLPS